MTERELMLALAAIEDRLLADFISRNAIANRKNPSGGFFGEILIGASRIRARVLRELATQADRSPKGQDPQGLDAKHESGGPAKQDAP